MNTRCWAVIAWVAGGLLFLPAPSRGHEPPWSRKEFRASLEVLYGVHELDLGAFNRALEARGLIPVDESFARFGLVADASVSRFRYGVSLYGWFGNRERVGDIGYRLFFRSYGAEFGYEVLRFDDFALTPRLVGMASSLGLDFETTENETFEDHLLDPRAAGEMSVFTGVLGFELGAQYDVWFHDGKKARTGLSIGVRAGQALSTSSDDYRLENNHSLSGGPEVQASGPYLYASLGWVSGSLP